MQEAGGQLGIGETKYWMKCVKMEQWRRETCKGLGLWHQMFVPGR